MGKSKKLKVAYIISIAHGLDAWTYREIEALIERDIQVTLFPLRFRPGPYAPNPNWDCYKFKWSKVILKQLWGFTNHPIKYLCLLYEALKMHSLGYFLLGVDFSEQMSKRKIDLIHCVFGDHKFFVGYYCKKILNIPLSVALYGYELKNNPNWRMLKKALPLADTIIVNCDYNKQLLADFAGQNISEKVNVIRHFAQIPDIPDIKKIRILIVGGFVPRKGHDVLFKAVKALGPGADEVEVWVVGYQGPVDVQQLAHDSGVEDKVIVFGAVADQGLKYLYQNCDIFCLPSKTDSRGVNEGLPVALIEAMAYAKPVVATRLGGIPEIVEEALVEEGAVIELAKALNRYICDPMLRVKSGLRNQKIVKSYFSEQNVAKMTHLWEEEVKQLSKNG
jgi:colanic acid/amylovoran biosynthesis glycosyltransferase